MLIGQLTYIVDVRIAESSISSPASKKRYRLHRLAKLTPKFVGHEFSEVAAARIFSMRSGFEAS